jgi:hypothetical protein
MYCMSSTSEDPSIQSPGIQAQGIGQDNTACTGDGATVEASFAGPNSRHSTTAESKPMGTPSPTEFCRRENDRYHTYMDHCCMLTLAGWSLQQQAVWDGTQADWTDQAVTEAPVFLTAREQGHAPPCWTCQYQGGYLAGSFLVSSGLLFRFRRASLCSAILQAL